MPISIYSLIGYCFIDSTPSIEIKGVDQETAKKDGQKVHENY